MAFSSLLAQACAAEFEYPSEEHHAASAKARDTSSWAADLGEFLWPLITRHDTEYAPDYSEESFRSLDLGSPPVEAEKALGRPLEVKEFPDGQVYWYYSRSGAEFDSYFVRILVFGQDGRLISKRRFFYVD
jgi:hypothetical protein